MIDPHGLEPRLPVDGRVQKGDGIVKDQRCCCQVLRGFDGFGELGRHHWHHPFEGKRQRIKPCIGPVSKANGHIDVVTLKIHDPQACGEPEFDFGMRLCKFVQPRREPFGGKGGASGDGERRMIVKFAGVAPCFCEGREPVCCTGGKGFSGLGQFNRAVQTSEERRAEMVFERLDLKRQGGGGYVQFLCGFGKGHVPCGSIKGAKGG